MLQKASTAPSLAPAMPRPAPAMRALLLLLGLLALVVPTIVVLTVPRIPVARHHQPPPLLAAPRRVIPKAELPPVEPVRIVELAPEDARSYNASIPFSTLPNPPARAFRLTGADDDRARAIDCLAAAEIYEAGDDAVGERAVAQVVLNRVRHPAFPNSVCGVVFQGSERSTGCQFTFTCDGAMARMPSAAAWRRAREIAEQALTGSVYEPVGHATHYHTDWVVPYWSSSLEKITEIHTHLFFRWAGWWGTPPAFRRSYAGAEPKVPQLAALSPAHAGPTEMQPGTMGALGALGLAALGDTPAPAATRDDPNTFHVALDRKLSPDAYAALAIRTCGERPYCKFMGWADAKAVPPPGPLSAASMATMSFSYLRDQSQGFAKALWNCEQFRRPSPVQCMRQPLPIAPAATPKPAAPVETFRLEPIRSANGAPAFVVPTLSGVRRKEEPRPEPASSPTPAAPEPLDRR